MKKLALLGSTGSIGTSTLDIVRAFPEQYQIVSLAAGRNIELLVEQIEEFLPRHVAVLRDEDAEALRLRVAHLDVEVHSGITGMIECATVSADMVVAAIVGAAGLVPTLAAIKAGRNIALANKETLVMAGSLIMAEVAARKVQLIPVDSEHSAIFQSLQGHRPEDIKRLILTASGGPFRDWDISRFPSITPADALAHPNWNMGRKISIDSATMMNKGLEIIEARWLFSVPADKIAVHVHPESIVHSLVEYQDGALIAQLGIPDMKTPIGYALSWPERLPLRQPPLDLCRQGSLTFSQPDLNMFPCLRLAYEAISSGGTLPAVMNAANEIAVDAFLKRQIGFLGISELIEKVMARHSSEPAATLDRVLQADLWGRNQAKRILGGGK